MRLQFSGRRSFGTGYSRDSDRDRGGSGRYGDRYGGRDDRYGYRDRYDRYVSLWPPATPASLGRR